MVLIFQARQWITRGHRWLWSSMVGRTEWPGLLRVLLARIRAGEVHACRLMAIPWLIWFVRH